MLPEASPKDGICNGEVHQYGGYEHLRADQVQCHDRPQGNHHEDRKADDLGERECSAAPLFLLLETKTTPPPKKKNPPPLADDRKSSFLEKDFVQKSRYSGLGDIGARLGSQCPSH